MMGTSVSADRRNVTEDQRWEVYEAGQEGWSGGIGESCRFLSLRSKQDSASCRERMGARVVRENSGSIVIDSPHHTSVIGAESFDEEGLHSQVFIEVQSALDIFYPLFSRLVPLP
jgi:hypothetical protein